MVYRPTIILQVHRSYKTSSSGTLTIMGPPLASQYNCPCIPCSISYVNLTGLLLFVGRVTLGSMVVSEVLWAEIE